MNDNSECVCIRCIIVGEVQGVFFRVSTRNQAQQFGITGYAKNLPDDCVEVIACGQQDAVDKLKNWLHKGPSAARVTKVQCESISRQHFSDFRIL